jgi:soluble lytic murein transglycosylase-like protein
MIGELYPSVDARLVMAIFAVDSSFKPKAESQNGARGLGQLTPEICNEFNIKDPFDIKENIRGTYMFLDKSFNKWKNEKYFLDLVIAAKCAGSDTVEKYNDIPPDEETQDYVRKVINLYEQLIFLEEKEEKLRGKTRYFNEEK